MTFKKTLARQRNRLLRWVRQDPKTPSALSSSQKRTQPSTSSKPRSPKPGLPKRPGIELALKQARLSYAPAVLHVSEGLGAEFHIELWIEHLREALGDNVFVILRSAPLFDAVKNREDIDCVYVRDGRDAEQLVYQCPSLRTVFYVSNTGNVVHFVRLNHLSHVFLGHGDSEKSASCHRFFRVYDEVWTAGQAHIDRFMGSGLRFESLDFKIVGRPGLKTALAEPLVSSGTRFLYLPTWEGYQDSQNYSSLALSQTFLTNVATNIGYMPVVKFHPWTGKQADTPHHKEETLSKAFDDLNLPIDIQPRKASIASVMHDVDFLICDISSVITDFLITLRPIFVYMSPKTKMHLASSRMPYTEYVYPFSTPEELEGLIDQVIVRGDDVLADARRIALNYFIDVEATLADRFHHESVRVCQHENAKV